MKFWKKGLKPLKVTFLQKNAYIFSLVISVVKYDFLETDSHFELSPTGKQETATSIPGTSITPSNVLSKDKSNITYIIYLKIIYVLLKEKSKD